MNSKITGYWLVSQLPKQALKLLTSFTLLAGVASCAVAGGEPKMYFHSFSFDAIADAKKYGHPDVEVLDYAYGESNEPHTRPSAGDREVSNFFYQQNVAGPLSRGEFLYVKWRVKATGEIYEDRVDLRHRLPADVTNYGIHFLIDGPQLYVFLLPPEEFKDMLGRITITGGSWTRDIYYSDRYVNYKKQHQIYPDAK